MKQILFICLCVFGAYAFPMLDTDNPTESDETRKNPFAKRQPCPSKNLNKYFFIKILCLHKSRNCLDANGPLDESICAACDSECGFNIVCFDHCIGDEVCPGKRSLVPNCDDAPATDGYIY